MSLDSLYDALGREEEYDCGKLRVWSWHKVSDVVEGVGLRLANMAGGFPFEAAGRLWASTEHLYLCGEFTDEAIQADLVNTKSGYAAKRFIKAKYRSSVRPDFVDFRIQWMLWCVWRKCVGNADFRKLLCSIPDDVVLVEDTTSDTGGTATIWGAKNPEFRKAKSDARKRLESTLGLSGMTQKEAELLFDREAIAAAQGTGVFRGQNNIGKILSICRLCLISGIEPKIDYRKLAAAGISIFGVNPFL